ncbi:MAG: ATP-dependent DNA ligase [Clostridiaceae bacterium]|nr:ATP-dependent DNA ligase [Clostridiaceae bacterium]
MEPILVPKVPEGNEYIHQVKWDGIRGLCYLEDGRIRVFTKKGKERTEFYPELLELPSLVNAKSACFDGELIILNEELRPSFQLSLIRERVNDPRKVEYYAKRYPVMYIVFDLLSLNGKLLTEKPLKKRSELLREHLKNGISIAITDDFTNGDELYSLMKKKQWEGVVSKNINSLYLPGKNHKAWFKTKLSRRMLAIVAGLILKDGNPNSLILALWGNEGLSYIGRASVGLTQEHLKLLKENISRLKSDKNPFHLEDKTVNSKLARELKNAVWFIPSLTVWVSFLEWTSDGGLRHPKILGFTSLPPEEATGKEYVE